MEKKREYVNRELSWMEFNERVLSETINTRNPLLERLKFLAITASNLDEFFMVRIGGVKHQIRSNIKNADISGLLPQEQSEVIYAKTREFIKKQYNYLLKSIEPKLAQEKIFFPNFEDLPSDKQLYLSDYFTETIFPILTPLAVDPGRPLPFLHNLSLNILVQLSDAAGKEQFAFIQVPTILDRFIEVPDVSEGEKHYILLEKIIIQHVKELFQGYTVERSAVFRITRDAFLNYNEDEAEDLLDEIKKSLKNRRYGGLPVRLEIKNPVSLKLQTFLMKSFNIEEHELYKVSGPIDLKQFFGFFAQCDRDDLKFKPKKQYQIPDLVNKDIFEVIKQKDILLHHPFNSFNHVTDFIDRSANDPNVLAIKQTLYRVSGNSPIIKSLMRASELGKQVTVLVELKARFDEERNIDWARQLEKAGCNVIYGLVGLKVHAKVCLVVRREEGRIVRYAHMGTGNYNDSTASLYTDLGMFTARRKVCADLSKLFNIITGYSIPTKWDSLSVAPFNIRTRLINCIREEVINHQLGYPAKIIMKFNSLVDKKIIDELYYAAEKGVKVELIVRGISCLRTNVSNLSENIHLVSVVGRYLEHSRIYFFNNQGNPKIYLSSADCMDRNFDRRIEIMFPIESEENKSKVSDILELYLRDTENTHVQEGDRYETIDKRGKVRLDVQEHLFSVARQEFKEYLKEEYNELEKIAVIHKKQ